MRVYLVHYYQSGNPWSMRDMILTAPYRPAHAAVVMWRRVFGHGGRLSGRGRLLWHNQSLGMAEVVDRRGRRLQVERIDCDPSLYLPASVAARRRWANRGPLALLPPAASPRRPEVGEPVQTSWAWPRFAARHLMRKGA